MKKTLFTILLPIIITSMLIFTKWWYVLPVDGPDVLFWGFPLAFIGEGFHTSMSFQIFLLNWFVDILCYTIFWLIVFLIIKKLRPTFSISRWMYRAVWTISIVLVLFNGFIIGISDPIFKLKKNYDWQIMTSGYKFIWQSTPRPDINKFHP
jgi:hypothetical protein